MEDEQDSLYYIQTGGYPVNQVLLLEDAENDFPIITAFIPDVEMDVFSVTWDFDGMMTIQTEDLQYIILHPLDFDLFKRLTRDAVSLGKIISDRIDEAESLDDDDGVPDLSDLITKPLEGDEHGNYSKQKS